MFNNFIVVYSVLGVLLEEWCCIDGNDVITLVGVVRNGKFCGRADLVSIMYNIFDPPPD